MKNTIDRVKMEQADEYTTWYKKEFEFLTDNEKIAWQPFEIAKTLKQLNVLFS